MFNYSLALNPDITEKLITYPSSCFTGVHYTHLKYQSMFQFGCFRENMTENKGRELTFNDTFIVNREWMRVYSHHGKFFNPSWIKEHERYMIPYYRDEHGTNRQKIKLFSRM